MAEAADRLGVEPGMVVSGFWPMRSEVDVRPLMFALRERGARLCLPAILDKKTIVFRELVRDGKMVDMGFGTFGPGPDAAELDPDLMLIPLAAFDDRGHRIGYGAGYYDRALTTLPPSAMVVAVIHPDELLEKGALVRGEHDVPIPAVLTADGLVSLVTSAGF